VVVEDEDVLSGCLWPQDQRRVVGVVVVNDRVAEGMRGWTGERRARETRM